MLTAHYAWFSATFFNGRSSHARNAGCPREVEPDLPVDAESRWSVCSCGRDAIRSRCELEAGWTDGPAAPASDGCARDAGRMARDLVSGKALSCLGLSGPAILSRVALSILISTGIINNMQYIWGAAVP